MTKKCLNTSNTQAMVCRTVIRNNSCHLSTKKLGSVANKTERGSVKYRLYKNKNSSYEDYSLRVIVNNRRGFIIDGSLRKWWFGSKNAVQDFNLSSFCKCVELLSKRLGVESEEIWHSNISSVEIGANVKLSRDYEFIIPAMSSYPRLQRSSYKNTYVSFPGTKTRIVAYDKTKEVLKNSSKKVREAICSKIFVLRFEIRLSPNQFTGISQDVNSLFKIKSNWNLLVGYWVSTYTKIEFNPLAKFHASFDENSLTRTNMKNFALAKLIELVGLEYFENVVISNFRSSKRSQEKRYVRDICLAFSQESQQDYLSFVMNAIEEKASRMRGL